MPKKNESARLGLRLALGGAPETWHTVTTPKGETVPGLFHPTIPTPVDAIGEDGMEYAEAERFAGECANGGLELVEMSESAAELAREAYRVALNVSKDGLRELKRSPRATDPDVLERIEEETEAIQKGEVTT